jgi:hypothetical protein
MRYIISEVVDPPSVGCGGTVVHVVCLLFSAVDLKSLERTRQAGEIRGARVAPLRA